MGEPTTPQVEPGAEPATPAANPSQAGAKPQSTPERSPDNLIEEASFDDLSQVLMGHTPEAPEGQEPEPGAEPEPQPEPTPEPQPEPQPEPAPEPAPEPQPGEPQEPEPAPEPPQTPDDDPERTEELNRISLRKLPHEQRLQVARFRELLLEGKSEEEALQEIAGPTTPQAPPEATPPEPEGDPEPTIDEQITDMEERHAAAKRAYEIDTEIELATQLAGLRETRAKQQAKEEILAEQAEAREATYKVDFNAAVQDVQTAHPEAKDPHSEFSSFLHGLTRNESEAAKIRDNPAHLKVLADRVAKRLSPAPAPAPATPPAAAAPQKPAAPATPPPATPQAPMGQVAGGHQGTAPSLSSAQAIEAIESLNEEGDVMRLADVLYPD